MTPIDWAKRPLQKYADFSGRAPRPEYWWFVLAQIVVLLVAMLLDSLLGSDLGGTGYGIIYIIVALALLLPSVAVSIRRLHDTNRSGWWLLLVAVPYLLLGLMTGMAAAGDSPVGLGMAGIVGIVALAGAIAILVFMILPGTPGDNRFGPPPATD